LELPPEAGEKHIQRSLDLQATVMRRKGVGEDLIVRDVADLSAAIRTVIWQAVMSRKEG
jgi:hypothetical protein